MNTLKRILKTDKVTIGILKTDVDIFTTIELPWKDNKRSISCIPTGTYKVKYTYSPKYKKDMWEILDVPDRDGIRIHSANFVSDLQGCIGVGTELKDINKDNILDITNSRKAIKKLKEIVGEEFLLKIE